MPLHSGGSMLISFTKGIWYDVCYFHDKGCWKVFEIVWKANRQSFRSAWWNFNTTVDIGNQSGVWGKKTEPRLWIPNNVKLRCENIWCLYGEVIKTFPIFVWTYTNQPYYHLLWTHSYSLHRIQHSNQLTA